MFCGVTTKMSSSRMSTKSSQAVSAKATEQVTDVTVANPKPIEAAAPNVSKPIEAAVSNASSSKPASSTPSPASSTPSPAVSPSSRPVAGAGGSLYVNKAEQLNFVYFRIGKKDKGGFLEMKVFDHTGSPVRKLCILNEEVKVYGPKLPFLEIKKNKTTSFDGGVTLPTGTLALNADDTEGNYGLTMAFIHKIEDAQIEYSYGLKRPGVFLKEVERVLVPGKKPAYTPRAHYSDGTVLDITQEHIQEVDANFMKFFVFSQTDEKVFFTDFSLIRPGKLSKGVLYLDFNFDIPFTQRSLKRKKNEEGTPQQADPKTWDIRIPQLIKVEGVWRTDATAGNMYPKMACICKPGDRGSFIGNVALHVEDIWPGKEFSLKLGGHASVINDNNDQDDGPYAPFGVMEDGVVGGSIHEAVVVAEVVNETVGKAAPPKTLVCTL